MFEIHSRRTIRWTMSFLAAFTAGACAGDAATPAAEVRALNSGACQALGAGQGGTTPAARDAGPSPSATPIPVEGLELAADVVPSAGLVLSGTDIFALDLALGHLWRLNPRGEVVGRYGRLGRGPGEFDAPGGGMTMGRGNFLGIAGDTLIAFDARSVHRFTLDGRHLSTTPIAAKARGFLTQPRRMRVAHGAVITESERSIERDGGRAVVLPQRYFHVWQLVGDSASSIEMITLPQLPRAGAGGFFGSPAEAKPSWDVQSGCLAIIDGSSNRLVLGDLGTGVRDTLQLPLPDRFIDVAKANASIPAEALPSGELPEPALLGRVVDLVLDPQGMLWLRPSQPDPLPADGIEVWLYDLRSRQFSIDTVPGLPFAFDATGKPFRITTDDEGVTRVLPVVRLH